MQNLFLSKRSEILKKYALVNAMCGMVLKLARSTQLTQHRQVRENDARNPSGSMGRLHCSPQRHTHIDVRIPFPGRENISLENKANIRGEGSFNLGKLQKMKNVFVVVKFF